MSAVISACGQYRYRLERTWGFGTRMAFIMLNPSTADASVDDPTIRKCMAFAKRWDFGGIVVGNLFGLRATDPKELRKHPNPIGPENDEHLERIAKEIKYVVAAWGTHGTYLGRHVAVSRMDWTALEALRVTKDGHPGHPLYVNGNTEPVPFSYG